MEISNYTVDEWAQIEARVMAHLYLPHPLARESEFRFVERDKRFGNLPVYKVRCKITNDVAPFGERVPETEVYVAPLYDVMKRNSTMGLFAIRWTRKSRIEEIKHAVAWLLMQDKEAVILRAFDP